MIERIEVNGKLVNECSIPGETRADDVFPGHPNGAPLSRDRWLIIYATRGWRKVDDDRSVIYQVRKDRPDGELLNEGLLREAADDWDPMGDGGQMLREHGHPTVFGVPKGALIDGRPAPNANVFVAKWRANSKGSLDPKTGNIIPPPEGYGSLMRVEWVQFRMNDRGDDIEIIQPPAPMRQVGYESGENYCSLGAVNGMNTGFVNAVPFNESATEWVDCHHFSQGVKRRGSSVSAMKYRFNEKAGLYEWAETGEPIDAGENPISEASIARCGDDWLIAARSDGAVGWVRTANPFAGPREVVFRRPAVNCPLSMYRCADGAIRLLTGEVATSPYGHGRNPLYLWDVDAESLEPSNPRVVFDCIASGTLPRETGPRAEMCKLLPHMGGRRQYLVWRVRTKNVGHQYGSLPPVTAEQKERHGLYYATIEYDREYPAAWEF